MCRCAFKHSFIHSVCLCLHLCIYVCIGVLVCYSLMTDIHIAGQKWFTVLIITTQLVCVIFQHNQFFEKLHQELSLLSGSTFSLLSTYTRYHLHLRATELSFAKCCLLTTKFNLLLIKSYSWFCRLDFLYFWQ